MLTRAEKKELEKLEREFGSGAVRSSVFGSSKGTFRALREFSTIPEEEYAMFRAPQERKPKSKGLKAPVKKPISAKVESSVSKIWKRGLVELEDKYFGRAPVEAMEEFGHAFILETVKAGFPQEQAARKFTNLWETEYGKRGLFRDDVVPNPNVNFFLNVPQEQLDEATRIGQQAKVFDPEGSGYDYETAEKYGIKPDEIGHFPSREPQTGLILKGRGHATFDKTIKGEEEAGYEIFKGEDGRYYSQPKYPNLSPEENVELTALEAELGEQQPQLIAMEEPGMVSGAVEKVREFIAEKTGLFAEDISPLGRPEYREEQKLKTIGQLALHHGAAFISGLGIRIPDILTKIVSGNDTLEEAIDKLTGFIPSSRDVRAGEAAKFIGELRTIGAGIARAVARIPARQILKTILSAGLTFGTRATNEAVSKKIISNEPISWQGIHFEAGLGVLFGAGEVAVVAVLTKLFPGMKQAYGVANAKEKIQIRKDANFARDYYKKHGKMPPDLMNKYVFGKEARTTLPPPAVKDFGKFPIVKAKPRVGQTTFSRKDVKELFGIEKSSAVERQQIFDKAKKGVPDAGRIGKEIEKAGEPARVEARREEVEGVRLREPAKDGLEAKPPVINVYRGVDTGKLFPDESKLKMERTKTGTKLVDIETGEEVILDQEASRGALAQLEKKPADLKAELPTDQAVTQRGVGYTVVAERPLAKEPLSVEPVVAPVRKVKPEGVKVPPKPAEAVTEKKPIKEIEREKEIITEPAASLEVEPGKTEGLVPTGTLDPTNPKEALEITKEHANWVAMGSKFDVRSSFEGIRTTKIVTGKAGEATKVVTTSIHYTPKQIDTAYRNVQKPVPSQMPDTELFAMPGKEAQLQAIAQKMEKLKGFPKKKRGVRITKPGGLPKAKTAPADHVKAVYVATAEGTERYALNGVKVEGDTIIATDGRRMFWAKGKWGKDGIYLDAKSLSKGLLGKPDKTGKIFPKWQDIVIDVSGEKAIVVKDLDKVLTHIRQASLITSEESRGLLIIANEDGSLGFSAATPEVGHVEINVWPGGKVLGGVNPRYLMDVLRFHAIRGDDSIEFYFPKYDRPILTKSLDGKTSTLTMPINIEKPLEAIKKAIAVEPEVKVKSKGLKKKPVGFKADPTIETEAKGEPGFAGIEGRPGGKAKKPWLDIDRVKSPDKEIEDFFGRTKVPPYAKKASKLMRAIKVGLRERFVTMTPHIEDVPETAIYRDMIRTLPEEVRQAGERGVRDIIAILNNDGTVQALDTTGLDLLRRKVFVQDILSEAEISRSVSGDLDKAALEAENKRLDALIEKVPSVKKAYEIRRKLWDDVSQDLLKRGVLDEETAKNKHYVRHFVLDLAEKNYPTGFKRKKLSAPYRAYAKKRTGSLKDISTDYLEVEVRALTQIYKDNAIEDIANKVGEIGNKRSFYTAEAREENIKNAGQPPTDLTGFAIDKWLKDELGGKFVTPEKLAEKDGYVEWHYKRPNLFYRAQTITESQIASLVESSAEEVGDVLQIPVDKMREALVLGRRKGMILPDWLAKQLNDLPVNRRSNYVVRSFTKPFVQFWKRWILRVNPIRYNVRNQVGDTERLVAAGQTAALKDVPKAVKILVTKEGELYELMKKYGVAGSTLWHEMNDVSTVKEFEKFKDYSKPKTLGQVAKKAFLLPLKTASKIGSVEQNLTQFREDILRVAVFINNYEKLQAGKPVRHWAGKLADIEEIAKTDKARAAAKISRETLGDYGAFTPFETDVLRQGIIPFYSWLKINTVFWPRVLKQAAKEGVAGKTLLAGAAKVGMNIPTWLVRIGWVYAAAYLWNHRDEEAYEKETSLPFWLRAMPHINTKDYTLWGQTAMSDFVEWIDYQSLAGVWWRYDAGFLDKKQAALESARLIAQAPVNKIYQSFNPFMKAPLTAITGQETWPSVFEPHYVATPASKKSFEKAVLNILGSDAKKFYESAKGDRKFEDTLYAYFAGWWARPTDPDTLIEEIRKTKEYSSLKRKSKTTGRKKGQAKKGKEAAWQEAKIRD